MSGSTARLPTPNVTCNLGYNHIAEFTWSDAGLNQWEVRFGQLMDLVREKIRILLQERNERARAEKSSSQISGSSSSQEISVAAIQKLGSESTQTLASRCTGSMPSQCDPSQVPKTTVILRDLAGAEVCRTTVNRGSSLEAIKDALIEKPELYGRIFQIVGEDTGALDDLDYEVLEFNVILPNHVGTAIEALTDIEFMLMSLSRLRDAAAEGCVSELNAKLWTRAAAEFPGCTTSLKLYVDRDRAPECFWNDEFSRFEFPACVNDVRQFACTDLLFGSFDCPELGMWAARLWAITEPAWCLVPPHDRTCGEKVVPHECYTDPLPGVAFAHFDDDRDRQDKPSDGLEHAPTSSYGRAEGTWWPKDDDVENDNVSFSQSAVFSLLCAALQASDGGRAAARMMVVESRRQSTFYSRIMQLSFQGELCYVSEGENEIIEFRMLADALRTSDSDTFRDLVRFLSRINFSIYHDQWNDPINAALLWYAYWCREEKANKDFAAAFMHQAFDDMSFEHSTSSYDEFERTREHALSLLLSTDSCIRDAIGSVSWEYLEAQLPPISPELLQLAKSDAHCALSKNELRALVAKCQSGGAEHVEETDEEGWLVRLDEGHWGVLRGVTPIPVEAHSKYDCPCFS